MKSLLIRDAATLVPAIAFRMDEPATLARFEPGREREAIQRAWLAEWIATRGGFGRTSEDHHRYVVLIRADGPSFRAEIDPLAWDDLTMTCAHQWLLEHLEEHPAGGALDVEPMREQLVRGRDQVEPAWSYGHHDNDDPTAIAG